jgi:hypothetical protein
LTFVGAAILSCVAEWKPHAVTVGGLSSYPYFGFVLLSAYTVFMVLLIAKTGLTMLVGMATVFQFLTLAVFGVVRQIGQNNGMARLVDVSQLPEAVQWDTLIAFVVIFLLGVGVIVWMVAQCVKYAGK